MNVTPSISSLIEALQIFLKYGDETYPTHCEHDELKIFPSSQEISAADLTRLAELGFHLYDSEVGGFLSFGFGSR